MGLRWSDIGSTLFGSVLRCHTTLTALILLLCAPAVLHDPDAPDARLVPGMFLVNWTFFALGKPAWMIRRKFFAGKPGPWFAMLGALGGAAVLVGLIFLFGAILPWKANRDLHDIFGCIAVAPFLSYGLHMLQENWKWVRWLVPLALLLPFFIQG